MPDERRRHKRKEVDLPGAYQVSDGERVEVHVKDMSLGGAFLEAGSAAPFGATVQLYIQMPDGKELAVSGVVRWTSKGGMGVQFGLLGAKQTYMLTEFLARRDTVPDVRV